jgi:hypothetical protein
LVFPNTRIDAAIHQLLLDHRLYDDDDDSLLLCWCCGLIITTLLSYQSLCCRRSTSNWLLRALNERRAVIRPLLQ